MRVSGIPYVQGRNSYSDQDGRKFAIAIHNTSNNASDDNEASYATRRTDGVSSHFYCDRDSVIQSLDTDAKAGHAGSRQGNENAVAVEITGANGWSRQQWLDNVAWGLLGRVLAQACQHYGIAVRRASVAEMQVNPTVKAFYGHNDMRLAWGGTDHTDPGPNFPWDRLFSAVNAALGGGDDDMTPDQDTRLKNVDRWAKGITQREDPILLLGGDGKTESPWPNKAEQATGQLLRDVADLKTAVAALETGQVSQAALNTAVAAALADSQVVADLVKAINDDAARRAAE